MAANVLLINARKPFPLQLLDAGEPPRLSVITEAQYAHRYGTAVTVRLVDDIYDVTQVKDAALEILREQGIDFILGPGESSLPVCGYLRSYFGLPGMGYEVANYFSNKYAMKRRLRAAGLPVAPFLAIADLSQLPAAAEQLGWPVVVKPVFGGGCVDIFAVSSQQEFGELYFSAHATSLRKAKWPLIVEKFIDMHSEYHCDGVVHDGKVTFAAVSKYFTPLLGHIGDFTGSYTLPQASPDQPVVRDLHARTVRALGLQSGVTHLELFRTSDGFLVGEITCRPAGGGIVEAIDLRYGVNIWRAFVDTSLDIEPRCHPRPEGPIIVNCQLPIRPGRVAAITAPAQLQQIPGVVRVDMPTGVGDVIDDHLHSSSTTGLIYLSVEHEAEVKQRVREVTEAFVLCVERTDQAVPAALGVQDALEVPQA